MERRFLKMIKTMSAFAILLTLSISRVAYAVEIEPASTQGVTSSQNESLEKEGLNEGATSSTPSDFSSDRSVEKTSNVTSDSEASDYVQRLMTAPQNPETMKNPASTTQLAITFAGLFAVIGMIFVVAWVVRRLSGGQFGQNGAAIKILATQPLGTKERLCLIDVGGQQVLVGITAQSMQTLMVLDQPIDKTLLKPSASWSSAESVNSLFGAKLQSMLKGSEVNEVKQSKVDD